MQSRVIIPSSREAGEFSDLYIHHNPSHGGDVADTIERLFPLTKKYKRTHVRCQRGGVWITKTLYRCGVGLSEKSGTVHEIIVCNK